MQISIQVIVQGFKQLLGIPYIYASHAFALPDSHSCSKVRYQFPFEGEWTVVNGGLDKETSHSWETPTQRYAYDYVIMDDNGKTYQGNEENVQSYFCYGKNVLAPADGVVVAVGDRCIDEKPFTAGKVEMKAKDIRGNFILIKHAEKEYGFVGHLQPHSVKVHVGQAVHCGEIIAKCGNTGNTSEPHIHFHLQDGKGFFTSAGIPILFQNIDVLKQKGYSNYDKRTVMDLKVQPKSQVRISRGQCVKNDVDCK